MLFIRLNRNRIKGGIVATIGYILSPLSWWNDLFINIPIAYVFATIVSIFIQGFFGLILVIGYWLTNILGLILLHIGAVDMISGEQKPYTKKQLTYDLLLSILYTVLIIILIYSGILTPPEQLIN